MPRTTDPDRQASHESADEAAVETHRRAPADDPRPGSPAPMEEQAADALAGHDPDAESADGTADAADGAASSDATDDEASAMHDEPASDESSEEASQDEDDAVDEEEVESDGGESDGEAEDDDEEEDAHPLDRRVEAVLFAARAPVKLKTLARACGRGTPTKAVREAIELLRAHYDETGRAFQVVEVDGTYQLMSRPEFAGPVLRLLGKKATVADEEQEKPLTPAALDTLSIVAYKQPITRQEVEAVRGVGCGPVMRTLLERGSIRVVGKKTDVLGQPPLYGTTAAFLQEFGLASLEELPMLEEMRQLVGASEALPAAEGEPPELRILERTPPEGSPDAAPDETAADAESVETDADAAVKDDPAPETDAPGSDAASAPGNDERDTE